MIENMIENRSASPGPIVPRLIYKDAARAIAWLGGAFGFAERLRTPPEPDGTIHHCQLAVGLGSVILTGQPVAHPDEFVAAVMVRVRDIDAHFAHAKQFGARILSQPDSKPFGERQYSAEDLEGHRWAFTESVADIPPESWGAQVAHTVQPPLCSAAPPAHMLPGDSRRGCPSVRRLLRAGFRLEHQASGYGPAQLR